MRTFLSIPVGLPVVLFGAMTLVGCYDLSTTGPHPEDFVREQNPSQAQQEQTQTAAGNERTPKAATTSALLTTFAGEAEDDEADVDRKLRVVPDDAP